MEKPRGKRRFRDFSECSLEQLLSKFKAGDKYDKTNVLMQLQKGGRKNEVAEHGRDILETLRYGLQGTKEYATIINTLNAIDRLVSEGKISPEDITHDLMDDIGFQVAHPLERLNKTALNLHGKLQKLIPE